MATQAAINKRQAEAEARINSGVSALADKFGIEIDAANYPVRDAEMRRLIEMENLASTLNQIVDAFGERVNKKSAQSESPESAFPEDYPGYEVLGQVEGMTPERIALMSDEEVLAIKGIGQKTLDAIRAIGK